MDLDGLNDGQRAAVTARDGTHLVVAGAGTGKTKTLVHRVAWLIEHGVPPPGIVLLTFTRRAAQEMLDRVSGIVGPVARGVRGGTFHAFAHTTLRQNARSIGFTPAFTLLDRDDAENLVGMVRAELGFAGNGRNFARKSTVLTVLSKAVNTGRTIESLLAEDYPQYRPDAGAFEQIRVRYQQRKRERDLMDYDDLLVWMATLLRDHPAVLERVAGSCRHVLVDEYQDTNKIQALIAALLSSVHGNLMVVGDEAQSIYAFRGAAVENILDFPKVFPESTTILLEQNYRSTPQILELANGVLDSMAEGFGKQLTTPAADGPKPELVTVQDEGAQADVVVRSVVANAEAGVDLRRQAVLFRSAHHANLLEVQLASAGVPFRKFGGLRFAEAAHVKDVVALLRVVVNPRDELSWFRILGWCEGIGVKTAEQLAHAIVTAEPPGFDPTPYRKRKAGPELVSLAALIADLRAERGPVAVVSRALVWYRSKMEALYDDAKKRAKDLDALLLVAERHETLEDALAHLTLDPVDEADEGEDEDDGFLTLSTIHSAKGLEWDHVWLIHLADGAFPSGYSLDDPDQLEEEKRLLYVAVTRARKRLTLIKPTWLHQRGNTYAEPGACMLLEAIHGLDRRVKRMIPGRPASRDPDGEGQVRQERLARVLSWYGRG